MGKEHKGEDVRPSIEPSFRAADETSLSLKDALYWINLRLGSGIVADTLKEDLKKLADDRLTTRKP